MVEKVHNVPPTKEKKKKKPKVALPGDPEYDKAIREIELKEIEKKSGSKITESKDKIKIKKTKVKPKKLEKISQEYDKKKGTVSEVYESTKLDIDLKPAKKTYKMKVPAEEMYFKKSKGPSFAETKKERKEEKIKRAIQNNRNNKRSITYDV